MLNCAHCIGTLYSKQRSPIYEMFGSETRQCHIDSNVLRYIAHLSGIGLQIFQVYHDLCLRAQLKKFANQGSFFFFFCFLFRTNPLYVGDCQSPFSLETEIKAEEDLKEEEGEEEGKKKSSPKSSSRSGGSAHSSSSGYSSSQRRDKDDDEDQATGKKKSKKKNLKINRKNSSSKR